MVQSDSHTTASSQEVHDPVSRVRMRFEPSGSDDLIVHTTLEPGGGLPLHLHPRQTEDWSVVEGQARIRVGDEERLMTPDDGVVRVERGVVHGIQSEGTHDARLRTLVSPALNLRAFLEESASA